MESKSIGNDIVDLRINEPRLHPRFSERVFSVREQAVIDDNPTRLWVFWAAKEAAFKALRRIEPGLVFSPIGLEVDVTASLVTGYGRSLFCHITETSEYVAVVCATNSQDLRELKQQSWIAPIELLCDRSESADPSIVVRELAIQKITQLLNLSESMVRVDGAGPGGEPLLYINEVATTDLLSLSHHGRFVACCFLRNADALSSSQKVHSQ